MNIAATLCLATCLSAAAANPTAPISVLWKNPQSRELYYGSGGSAHQPRAPYTFVKEMDGASSPKFIVKDAAGKEWRVKLGPEAKAETAATRLIWAAGYYTDDDYMVKNFRIKGLPKELTRGQNFVHNGTVEYGRFERSYANGKYLGSWDWKQNPFTGTRELNGLKIMMALVNNWDLKNANTTIYELRDPAAGVKRHVYLIGDLGATFGRPSYAIPNAKSDPKAYRKSEMVAKVEGKTVDFNTPSRPPLVHPMAVPHMFFTMFRHGEKELTRDIPTRDARWMGGILARLSETQIRSAFRAAGYNAEEVSILTREVRERIAVLRNLR
ncbi:hypothetical protein F183_A32220 [Bryobacterales bacterium F-183]|nr:hypothetical protein F183_A32220 [Bryobacterales bacterium F-183]